MYLVTVNGGLPVFAEISGSADDWWVDSLHWVKRRKGKLPTPGAQLSEAAMNKLIARDSDWQCHVMEQVESQAIADQAAADEYRADQLKDEQMRLRWEREMEGKL